LKEGAKEMSIGIIIIAAIILLIIFGSAGMFD